jgi:hypothetical protein
LNEEDRFCSDQRAKTLVIRCWHERGDDDVVWLRGTIRDLSRGRSLAFEGVDALLLKLPAIIADSTATGSK